MIKAISFIVLASLALAGIPAATAQSPVEAGPTISVTKQLAFDVASVRPSQDTNDGWKLLPTPDGYSGTNISLRQLIGTAYGVDTSLVYEGPAWIKSQKFDVEAKFDPANLGDAKGLTSRQRADMLQPLLADRFKLKVHRETRVFPVYNLVVAKSGAKLRDVSTYDPGAAGFGVTCVFRNGRGGNLSGKGCPLASLAALLKSPAGRTVLDKTGIAGKYDFDLIWTPDSDPTASGASIFIALQEQLGLKLDPDNAPMDVIIVDSAERPSQN